MLASLATLWSESRRARTTIGESARILHSKAMKPPKQRFDSTQWRGTEEEGGGGGGNRVDKSDK